MADTNPAAGPPLNAITWTEIPCTEFEPMVTFYKTIFDWNMGAIPEGDISYMMFDKGPCHGSLVKTSGKILSPSAHALNESTAVRVTISVDSVDEYLEKIVKAGGQVYRQKMELPDNMGVVAHFLDPAKNVMGLWSMK